MSGNSAEAASGRARVQGRPRLGVLVASVLFAVSLVTAGFYGVSWAIAAHSESLAFATQRDEALRVGSQAVVNLHTLDRGNLERGLDLWERSTAGPLHQEISRSREEKLAELRKANATSRAEVLDAALTSLDPEAGKAQMIAVVKVTITPQDGKPVTQRARYQTALTREGDEWKLSALGPVQSE